MEENKTTKYTQNEESKKEKSKKVMKYIGCNNCHKTDVTLIKASDSYYCKFCFDKLKKEKFKKKGKK